jgi:25S rRNA (uracil2843-N3)-methyltransferase
MDMTLTGNGKQERGKEEEEVKWEKLVSDESRWFRLQESLKYPIPLENMRCQVHLFRRL